jgi:hypothetical protein
VDADILNTLVTDAIWRAEELEALGIPASSAWKEVSAIEEKLAKAFPVSDGQGRIARRGAVSAALKSGDSDRAQALADAYIAEEAAMKQRFQHAAPHVREARDLARRFREAGAFGLAA